MVILMELGKKRYVRSKSGGSPIGSVAISFPSILEEFSYFLPFLTPKGPKSIDGFFGSSDRLSRCQKHECSSKILEEGGPM
jgi:hypothetical protein